VGESAVNGWNLPLASIQCLGVKGDRVAGVATSGLSKKTHAMLYAGAAAAHHIRRPVGTSNWERGSNKKQLGLRQSWNYPWWPLRDPIVGRPQQANGCGWQYEEEERNLVGCK
jgi:hypothetical protein